MIAVFGSLLLLYGWGGRVGMLDFAILEALFLVNCVRMIWHMFYAVEIRHRISVVLCAIVLGVAIALMSIGRLQPIW